MPIDATNFLLHAVARDHTSAFLCLDVNRGRVMVFMTHNTDVSDSWEREGEDPGYFYKFSIDGYRVAVNVLIYAMTH
jgi:hypothetical protein